MSPLPLPTSSPATSLPTPSHVLLPLQLHLSACNKEGDGEGNKSNGDCNERAMKAREMATATKRARARVARGMGTATKRAMTRVARAMSTATRVVCD